MSQAANSAAQWAGIVGIAGACATVLSGLGGYVLAGRNEDARDRRAASREAAARHADLADRLGEQRHSFQQETLLQLQDELQRYVRSIAKILMHDRDTLRGPGQLTRLPTDLDDEAYQVGISVSRLQGRLLSADLRAAIAAFRTACIFPTVEVMEMAQRRPTHEVADWLDEQLAQLSKHYEALAERLGAQIRAELERRPSSDGR